MRAHVCFFVFFSGLTLAQHAEGQQQTSAGSAKQPLQVWSQCGGEAKCEAFNCADDRWQGASCPGGSTCQRVDRWYWHCKPDSAAAGNPAAGTPTDRQQSVPPAPVQPHPVPAEKAEKPGKQLQLWDQCGGQSHCEPGSCADAPWGPAAPCPKAASCQRENNWFWQCKPDPAAASASAENRSPDSSTAAAAAPAAQPAPAQAPVAEPARPAADLVPQGIKEVVNDNCSPYIDTQRYRKTNFTDTLNTTTKISPFRANADRPKGVWIPGRATYYAVSKPFEDAHIACGEPPGQYGILEQGSCGFTNSDGSLVYPKEMYAAAASNNIDFAGSCGRCYEVRCKTGAVRNNGRDLLISDLQYGRPYPKLPDDYGRISPGNPRKTDDLMYVQCWNESRSITVRIGDSCPCKYYIKYTQEVRTQHWCCGGHNHFDLSFYAFQELAHPAYGVMPLEYRPVDCATRAPLKPAPGFISKVLYTDDLQPGWGWRPYLAKNFVLLAAGAGLDGSTGTCATLSRNGAVVFFCRECTKPGYRPFTGVNKLEFWIRSNTPASADQYASSTPAGKVPGLKVFLMQDEESKYCGREVVLGAGTQPSKQQGDWHLFSIPLEGFACNQGSAGSLANINRIDFQNIEVRDADVCLDNISLV